MATIKTVEEYIEKHSKWSQKLGKLRNILLETELVEEIKWGAPSYTLDGKILIGFAAFKNHMGIWFHQGVFLKDTQGKLVSAQEKTKALRQWRFEEDSVLDESLILSYVREAIENALAGKEIKPVRLKTIAMPPELDKALKENLKLDAAFTKLTPGKQNEYKMYIAEAKREATKQSRIEKITPMVLENKGLNDKYKNC